MKHKAKQILETAKQKFAENGYRGTSIQSIADALEISKGAIYLHFKSKEQILIALLQNMDSEVLEKIWAAGIDNSLTKNQQFHKKLSTMVDMGNEHKLFSELFLNDEVGLSAGIKQYIVKSRQQWQLIQQQILIDQYGDEIKPWAIELSLLISGMINEIGSYILFEKIDIPVEPTITKIIFYIDSLVNSLIENQPEPFQALAALHSPESSEKENDSLQSSFLIQQLRANAEQLDWIDMEEKALVIATLDQIKLELESAQTNKVILRGLLLGLGNQKKIVDIRTKLAKVLNIKL